MRTAKSGALRKPKLKPLRVYFCSRCMYFLVLHKTYLCGHCEQGIAIKIANRR